MRRRASAILALLATFGPSAAAEPGTGAKPAAPAGQVPAGRRVEELTGLLARLQDQVAAARKDGADSPVDLTAAQASLDAARTLLDQVKRPPAAPARTALRVAGLPSDLRELPPGATLTFGGLRWAAQTPRIKVTPGGDYLFSAKAGERADFDPPRKIRTEFVGLTQFAKGAEIRLRGRFNIDPGSVFTGAEWCSIVQIHQADTRRTDGTYVNASPPFSIDILPDRVSGKPYLQVRGETGRGEQPTFSPMRILGKLPDIELGKDHTLDMIVVDGHGERGRISVWIDGQAVVDRSDIPTGYEYVDLLAGAHRINGKPQPTTSYLKIGVYAGRAAGDSAPDALNVAFTWADR